jgi:hypothetical protein
MEAVLVSSETARDLAIIRLVVPDAIGPLPTALFDFNPIRGRPVWFVGNPSGNNFEVSKSTTSGQDLFVNQGKTLELISFANSESYKSKVRPGYSGGGAWSASGGLLGIVERGNEEFGWATSAKSILEYLRENGYERH